MIATKAVVTSADSLIYYFLRKICFAKWAQYPKLMIKTAASPAGPGILTPLITETHAHPNTTRPVPHTIPKNKHASRI